MRTIGRHWPSKAPRGDFQALCDYCGVMWRRSQLKRDRAGMLACPDDAKGKDGVTLAQENAAQAGQPRGPLAIRDGGNYDNDGQQFKQYPRSILGDELVGWWAPQRLLGDGAVRTLKNTPQNDLGAPGDVQQGNIARQPVLDGLDLEFDGTDYLVTNNGNLLKSGDSPCIWGVTSQAEAGNHAIASAFSGVTVGLSITRSLSAGFQTTSNLYSVSGTVTAAAPVTDAGLHLVSARMETDRLVIKVDGTEYSSAASGTLSAAVPGFAIGASVDLPVFLASGRVNEVVLTRSVPTAAQIADLEAYFKRTYTELP